eukprot:2800658-Pleurochrysis_carterae.AAC.1
MCKLGHPVATLPNNGGDYTSLSLKDVNSANHNHALYCYVCLVSRLLCVQTFVALSCRLNFALDTAIAMITIARVGVVVFVIIIIVGRSKLLFVSFACRVL